MSPAGAVGWLLLAPAALADVLFLAEVGLGLVPGRHRASPGRRGASGDAASPPARAAVLVPAHDEEPTLRARGADLAALAASGLRVLLVADNCSDDTAGAARALGLEVTERRDPSRRGKGYALAHGRDALALDPPDVVVVVDADCSMDPASATLVAARAAATGRPVQATYLIRPDLSGGPTVQISGFAMLVKNLVRQRGAGRLTGAAVLNGTGMAMPWSLFAGAGLATGEVVEDLVLGLDMVRAGRAPLFEERARVWSSASSESGTREQRARWEGGFLATAGRHAPGLVARGLARGDGRALWLGLHLCVPPLALLVMVNAALAVLLGTAALLGGDAGPARAAAALLAAVGTAVLVAWAAYGRPYLSAGALLRVPFYVAWKLGLYLRLALGRQRLAWTRTERVD